MKRMETTRLRWAVVPVALGALWLAGCELDETNADASDGGAAADAATGGDGAALGDAAGTGGDGGSMALGCEADGYCNPACWNEAAGLADDPDCTALCQPQTNSSCSQGADPNCSCNYYNFVCEAGEKCSMAPCACDPDCATPDGMAQPCAPDGRCDTWCPTDTDPDCPKNGRDDGEYCGGGGGGNGGGTASCDETPGNCDAQPGTANDCATDLDCDGLDVACEGDAWCDPKCPVGVDPDCQ